MGEGAQRLRGDNLVMPSFTPKQLILLVLLTIVWGLNWPVMKLGVQHFPPLTFRMVSMWIGLPILAIIVMRRRLPIAIPRSYWGQLAKLTLFNMVLWHCLIIIAIPTLSSGRAAILGYTMPIFSAILGSIFFNDKLGPRAWAGVGAAFAGVLLLLWHEVGALGSKPVGVMLMLIAAASWAWGTQLLRRTVAPVPLLSLSLWMVGINAVVLTVLAVVFERHEWVVPDQSATAALLFNGFLALAFAQATWFYLARSLPPVASTLSVMMVPVLGVFVGAWWLGEVLHWQDWTAVCLMVVAIASVLWPSKKASAV